ncbi:hypothetical protein E2C01_038182 [Portunus trituberculatus]|uniref:Uncharacterized protein n=1 Tax=Portunus trituberculatus TaxID=210409 RepID=A0A5B7FGW6_PORTR|nr:hypothetical protein [Portunus trituberculatus]
MPVLLMLLPNLNADGYGDGCNDVTIVVVTAEDPCQYILGPRVCYLSSEDTKGLRGRVRGRARHSVANIGKLRLHEGCGGRAGHTESRGKW